MDELRNPGNTIWVLEEDQNVWELYEETLAPRFDLLWFKSLEEMDQTLKEGQKNPALLLSNLKFKDGYFLDFFSHSKKLTEIPIVIISAMDDLDIIRFCLKQGIRDYLSLPIKKNLLLVKVEKAIGAIRIPLVVETTSQEVSIDGVKITNLTFKQFQLLNTFMSSPLRRVQRKDLLQKVWGKTNVHPKTIDVHLYNLRRKIGPFGLHIKSEGGGHWALLSNHIQH